MAKTGSWVYRDGKLVPKHLAKPLPRGEASDLPGPMVISDIDPYRAAAADKASGKRPLIGGRRQHREFMAANGYREVGNEMPVTRRETMSKADRIGDIKRAMGE